MKSLKSIALFSFAFFLLVSCQKENLVNKDLRLDLESAAVQSENPGSIPDQYIVVFKDDVSQVEENANKIAKQYGAAPGFVYKHSIRGFSIKLPQAAIDKLKSNPNIKYIEQDQISTANDFFTGTQQSATWGIDRVDQRDLSLNNTYTYSYNGSSVDAYIFDTGIFYSHTDFGGRAKFGFDAISSTGLGLDKNGHGTHVAGTVGGTTWGVAKAVNLFAVKVLNDRGSGTNSGIIAGIDWAVNHHINISKKPAVGNMSLGGGASTALDDAVKKAITNGIVMCVAAGNETVDASTKSPARVPAAITVGATTSSDAKADYSNFGALIDINAPGSSITSAWHTSSTATNTISGTSMATPHVAGAAVLYLDQFNTASVQEVRDGLVVNATAGKISGLATNGTVNLMLHTIFIDPASLEVPSTPTLSSPFDTESGVSTKATMIWGASNFATSYELNFSKDPTFPANVTTVTIVNDPSAILTSLSTSTKYYWKVRARNYTVSSPWSSIFSFTTASSQTSAVSAPTLSSPIDGFINLSTSLSFIWIPEALAFGKNHQFVLSTNPDGFTSSTRNITTISSSVNVTNLRRGTKYYWVVRAAETATTWGPWSKPWSVTISK